jgi:hypothetical protein
MTKFSKENLHDSNGWISYGSERKFVANFTKRGGGKAAFVTFLIKNYTVEEYFTLLDVGMTPLMIVQEKGYVLPHIKKWLKKRNLPQTQVGLDTLIQQNIDRRISKAA